MPLDQSKRIFILGAGSSIGHSKGLFPSITGFFASAKKLGIDLNAEYGEIVEYTKSAFGRDILDDADHFIDIEDLFTSIEIELERKSSPKFVEIRQGLLRLIQRVLLGLEGKIKGHRGHYDDLLNFLGQGDTIITFNWDILLDNKLGREKKLADFYREKYPTEVEFVRKQYDQFMDQLSARYGTTWASMGTNPPYENLITTFGYYLKVHGSVDWSYCANELCRNWYRVYPMLEPLKDYNCYECHEKVESLVVPPVLNKGYRQSPIIRRIWSLAAQEIRGATDLIIWGYSLPPTDFYSKWLLRQARNAPLEKLVIINHEIADPSGKENITFKKRFSEIYCGLPVEDKISCFRNFEEYKNSI